MSRFQDPSEGYRSYEYPGSSSNQRNSRTREGTKSETYSRDNYDDQPSDSNLNQSSESTQENRIEGSNQSKGIEVQQGDASRSTYSEKYRNEPSKIVGEPTDFMIDDNKGNENIISETVPRSDHTEFRPKTKRSKAKPRSDSKRTVKHGLKTGAKLLGSTLKHGATAVIMKSLSSRKTPSSPSPEEEPSLMRTSSNEAIARSGRYKEHNAPIEHIVAKIAHKSHRFGSSFGHLFAKSLRNLEVYVEVDEEKRLDLERRAAMLGTDPQTGERKVENEMTSIEDINFAIHEICDLMTAKLLTYRDKLIEQTNKLDERETHAILTGDDMVKRTSKLLKNYALRMAVQTTQSVRAALTEKDSREKSHEKSSRPRRKERS